jgi:hypothetical protein
MREFAFAIALQIHSYIHTFIHLLADVICNITMKGDTIMVIAIVTIQNQDGTYDSVGTNNCFILHHPSTDPKLIRRRLAAVERVKGRTIRLEYFYGNRMKEVPDNVIYVSILS